MHEIPKVGLIDLNKREQIIQKLYDILSDEDFCLVEKYGILEHLKFIFYTEAVCEELEDE